MQLGQIIIKDNKTKINTIDFVNVTTDTSKVFSSNVPVLIVGKSFAQDIVGKDNIKVLNRIIDKKKNISWTYGKTEKRIEFERDIEKFNIYIIENIKKKINYKYYNVLTTSYSCVKRFINYFNSPRKKYIYITDKQLYIYDVSNVIYGISIDCIKYRGISFQKILNKLRKNQNNIICENCNFLSKNTMKIVNNDNILLTYLCFLYNS